MAASPLPIDTDPLAPSDPAADAIHTAPLSDPAPLPDTRPMSPPVPWLLDSPRMLTAPPMSVDFAVPASSVSSEPASLTVTRTDHHCDAPGRVRCCSAPLLTDTAPVPALVEAPLDTDTPPVLPSSSSPDADSIRTSPLVLPMPPAPEDRVSDPPLTAEAGSREETGGFLVWFPYRWQHVHWAPVAPHRKR